MKLKFKKCPVCGNTIGMIKDSNVPIICCGKPMITMEIQTTDGSLEKHVPVYEVKDDRVIVRIGQILHPSTKEHYIEWVALRTNLGTQRREVGPEQVNEVVFPILKGEKVEAVYAYCNIHELYKNA